jgi:hypothetical protein
MDEPKKPKRTFKTPPTGRPTKLTKELLNQAETLIINGCLETSAAEQIGINWDTWMCWKNQPKNAVERTFSDAIKSAKAKAENRMVLMIQKAQPKDWRAAAWALTHNKETRENWSDAAASRRAVQESQRLMIDTARRILPDDMYERLLLTWAAEGACQLPGDNNNGN